ncbi:MAG: hypothetical protein IJF16_01265 [Clostridia bacterium]|nr:hypothetical protein [Clostridia bacterium]
MKKLICPLLALSVLLVSCSQGTKDAAPEPIIIVEESLTPSVTSLSPTVIPTASPEAIPAQSSAPNTDVESDDPAGLDHGTPFSPDDEDLPQGQCVRLGLVPSDVEFSGLRDEDGSYTISGVFKENLYLSIERLKKTSTQEELGDLIRSIRVSCSEEINITEDPDYSAYLARPVYRADYASEKGEHRDVIVLTENYTYIVGTANSRSDHGFMVEAWLSDISLSESFWWPKVEQSAPEDIADTAPDAFNKISVSYNKEGMEGWEEYTPDPETGAIFALSHPELGEIIVSADYPDQSLDSIVIAQNMMDDLLSLTPISLAFGPYDFELENGISGVSFYILTDTAEHHYITVHKGLVFDIMLIAPIESNTEAQNILNDIFLDDSFDIKTE